MRTSKILTIAVAFALLASALMPILGVGPVANAAADDPVEVKIGMLNPITGPIAVYAPAFTDAAELAISHLNDGQDAYHFSLVEGDSGCDGTTAASAAQTLVDSDVVGIAGAACSGATLGAQPVASEAGVPMVSYASTSPAVTVADDGDFLFRVVPSDAQQGVAMASMAAAHGWQNPGLIYMTNDYGAGLAGVVKAAYAAAGKDMCVEIGYDEDTTDFSTQVAELAAAECDSLITVTYATDGAALMEEMALQGIEGPTSPVCSEDCPFPIMGADGIADMGFLAAFSDPSAATMVIATKPASGTDSDAKDAFEAAWAEYYDGNASEAIYTHETYDAVTMIGHAAMDAECASQTCGVAVRDSLRVLGDGYSGASGTHSFDQAGDVAGSGYDVCQFVPVLVDGAMSLQLACNGHFGTALTFPGAAHIKIGMLNPITGPIAVYSPGFSIAAGVAETYMNTIQPLNFQFEVIQADSGCDGTTAATGAQTLIDAGVVGIAGAACSGATLGAIEVAKTAGVPMVSYASTSPAITNYDDGGYLFRVVPSDAQQGVALARTVEASESWNTAVISMTNDYGAGFAAAFTGAFENDVCMSATYDEDTTDFSSIVSDVMSNGCDSVVMITYATDGAALAEELATQEFGGMIFGGDGIADESFADAFSDIWAMEGMTVTRPSAGSDSALGAMFDMFYGGAAAAAGYEGGIYTREVFDAVAIIGLAQATALRTPVEDSVVDMLGTAIASPTSPQEGAAGVHAFDANGDVAGNGFDVCTFWIGDDDGVMLDCHSSWGLFEGLEDDGIPVNAGDGDDCPFSSDAGIALCEEQDDDVECDGETEADGAACAEIVMTFCAENEDDGCSFFLDETEDFDPEGDNDNWTFKDYCNWEGFANDSGPWEQGFCGVLTAEPEVVSGCMNETANNYNAEATEDDGSCTFDVVEDTEVEEAADEVPGFGLISAVAAIGAVLLLRRRL